MAEAANSIPAPRAPQAGCVLNHRPEAKEAAAALLMATNPRCVTDCAWRRGSPPQRAWDILLKFPRRAAAIHCVQEALRDLANTGALALVAMQGERDQQWRNEQRRLTKQRKPAMGGPAW